jgi:hypothetical protein
LFLTLSLLGRRRTRQERYLYGLYERNQHFPWSADRAVHDPAAPVDAQVETSGRGIWITKDVSELRIDYVSTESPLLGVWQALYSGRVLDFKEVNRPFVHVSQERSTSQ